MSYDEIAISARGLGKSYLIEHKARKSTAAETLLKYLANPLRQVEREEIWALQDVSFEIKRGEIVGVVGGNGAGKSTLLKILSRISVPTTGEARIAGRIGSLIEVGTGFQPELTGRENIYLNGAILGMRKSEIKRRFDEIVDFSGVEKFLDTPVKRYSSGMYIRLAFSVAAHLDTEILLVDEILSVGDTKFQKKSIGKIEAIKNTGRTVLFVSHNTATLEALCTSALLLNEGRLIKSGSLPDIISEYNRQVLNPASEPNASNKKMAVDYGKKHMFFRSADMVDERGSSIRHISIGDTLHLNIEMEVEKSMDYPTLIVWIDNMSGQNILTVKSPNNETTIPNLEGRCQVDCKIEFLPLTPGSYTIDFALCKGGAILEEIHSQILFTVGNADIFGDGWGAANTGVCIAKSEWSLVSSGDSNHEIEQN